MNTSQKISGNNDTSTAGQKQTGESIHIFRAMADNAGDAIAISNLEGKMIYSNRAAYELLGYDYGKRELDGAPMDTFAPEQERARQAEAIGQIMATGSRLNTEAMAVRKDGSTVNIAVTMFPIFDEQNRPTNIGAILRNISERKQTEEVLAREQSFMRALMDSIPDNIYFKDLQSRFLLISKSQSDDFSLSDPSDAVGKSDFDFFTKEHAQPAYEDEQTIIRTGQPITKEERETWMDRPDTWVLTTKLPLYDETGKLAGIFGISRDITERKKAEESLREANARVQTVLDAATQESIIATDPDGMITIFNAGAEQMLGYSAEEMVGKQTPAILHLESEVVARGRELSAEFGRPIEGFDIFIAYAKQGRYEERNWTYVRKDGVHLTVSLVVTALRDSAGNIIGFLGVARDITERKLAEEMLMESKELYQALIDTTATGYVIIDGQGNVVDANAEYARLAGYHDLDEIHGRNPVEWTAEYEQKRNAEAIQQCLKDGYIRNLEIDYVSPNGKITPVEINATVVEGRIMTVCRDISERKQAEAQLNESEARYQLLSEATIEGIVIHDKGILLDANQTFAAMFGYEQAEVIGMAATDFLTAETREITAQNIRSGYEKPYEVRGLRKDGTTFPVEITGKAIPYQGRTVRVTALRDITERKQAEQAVRENEQRFRALFEGANDAIFTLREDILIDCNSQTPKIFKLDSKDQIIGHSVVEFSPEFQPDGVSSVQKAAEKINLALRGEAPVFEWKHIHGDGTPFDAEVSLSRLEIGGEILVQAIIRDITERKRLESQVQQAFERRGYQVQVSTEISQEIASASEVSDLFGRVVTLTKERLGYYHTQLLRYDPAQDAVVLIRGYGETGQKMLASGHKLLMGAGLIGTAAATGQTVLRSTLADDFDWQPNPLLPDTKGEIAVPIKFGEQILGVLDVQSDQAGALTEDDRLLLEGLCGQVAIAMQSAELVKTIRENEARLAEAAAIAQLGSWELDIQTLTFTLTDEAFGVFRTTAKEQGGYQMSAADYTQKFVHPDAINVVADETRKAIETDDPNYTKQLEHRMIRADGSEGVIVVKIRISKNEQGRTVKTSGIFLDITERKQAELAVQESQARLTEALRMAKLAYWEHNLATNQFELNDQYYAICRTTAEQEGGYTMSPEHMLERFVHPEDHVLINQSIAAGLQSTDRHYRSHVDHRVIYADGSGIGHAATETNIERDEQGHITRIYGSYQDITERHKAQEEMAERLEEINRLYRGMSHEGWKTYRETENLPAGFMFDQASIRPVDESVSTDELFANIPMKVLGGEAVGTLSVADDPQRPMLQEDLVFLQQVSDQVALALENARLSAQTQSALTQSEKLFEASRGLAQASDLQELVKTIVETVSIQGINRAIMATINYGANGEMESMDFIANWWNGTGHEPTPVGTHYTSDVMRTISMIISSIPVFFSDLVNDERTDSVTKQIAEKQNIRGIACLPLYIGTQQIGEVLLEAEEPHNFTQDETRLFTALAPQIATMLENRRQYERAQKQAERESTLNIISQKIQGATTVEAVLQIAARELGQALGAPRTIAQLSLKDKK